MVMWILWLKKHSSYRRRRGSNTRRHSVHNRVLAREKIVRFSGRLFCDFLFGHFRFNECFSRGEGFSKVESESRHDRRRVRDVKVIYRAGWRITAFSWAVADKYLGFKKAVCFCSSGGPDFGDEEIISEQKSGFNFI